MKKTSTFCVLFLLALLGLSSCGSSEYSEWTVTPKGVRIYLDDTVSTLFSKITYEWEGESLYGLAHGRGRLVATNKDGEEKSSKSVRAFYGLTSSMDIEMFQTEGSSVYFGGVRKGEPHGFGLMKTDGFIYIGSYRKGDAEGHFYILAENGRLLYDGELKKGELEGYGTMYAEDTSYVYTGEFKNGDFSGYGTISFVDGLWYRGHFKRGVYSGHGILYAADSTWIYEGKWKYGMPNGRGTLYDSTMYAYTGTHIWHDGEISRSMAERYDRLAACDDVDYERMYHKIQRYELNAPWYITGLVLFLLVLAVVLIWVNRRSAELLQIRKDPIDKKDNYILWAIGGLWGLHRANLCVNDKGGNIWIMFMSQYLLFALLLSLNLVNIAICGFSPEAWRSLSEISLLTIVIFWANLLWFLIDILWISYRVYLLTSLYYRRSPEELDILNGKETKVEKFYKGLGGEMDEINGYFQKILKDAEVIMKREFVQDKTNEGVASGVIAKMKKAVSRDGSLEFEQKKLDDMIALTRRADNLGLRLSEANLTLSQYLAEARLAAYRNLYLAKELIAQIREMSGKSQELKTDAFADIGSIDINIDWSATTNVTFNIDGALDTFSNLYSGMTSLGIRGGVGAAVSAGVAVVGAVMENISARNEQKEKAVKAQAKIVDGLNKGSKEMLEATGLLLRNSEKVSALFMANKAFVSAYSHLRDTVFGEVSVKSWWKGVNKNNPVFSSEQFLRDMQHLVKVCSEYNKINQTK